MISCLSVGKAVAQQKKNFQLADFIDSAKHHLPLLLQKKALVDAASAGVTEARHAYLPNAIVADELNLGTDNSLPGSYVSYGIIPSTSSGLHPANNYQSATGNFGIFQSNYELMDFGFRKSKINNAKAYTNLTQADLDREIYLISWETAKLYFDILKNQFQLGIDLQNENRYEAIYRVIQAVTRSGIRAGADSSLALAELSKSRISYNQTEGVIRKLQEQMSYLTGISMNEFQIDTSQTKNYLSALDILARATYTENQSNPLTDYYQKQQALYLQTEDLAKKSYLPRVFLTATGWARGSSIDYNGEYKSLSQGLGYQRFNYMVGATFVYDLFSGVHRKDKVTVSHLNTEASNFDLLQQQLYLRNVENKADQGIQTAVKNLLEIPVQIGASQDTYNQKIAQYRAGIINLIDLTNASFVLYRSQSDYVQALSDWLLANLDKAASTGNLDLFIQSVK
jgi:outer membrane protein TolC